ncbi:hypothetical protein QJS04_geneDACA005450 [Acorus gramineus]|uniref:GTP-binding protein LepA C-terminal domain-containing protein n=1 Tax=Acorus gramineus TaxID=55184 RepID=A0AAV9A4D8_ACOGR|nr:hypothetical protein QJS04_geneDACA005450 [Acorus gramineus]
MCGRTCGCAPLAHIGTLVPVMRKNVLAKCHGGDATRMKEIIEKQKEGKKHMNCVGSVDIPREAFHELLKVS